MNHEDVGRALRRIAHEIIERHRGVVDVALVGIHTRGVYLARFLSDTIAEFEGVTVPIGELDISLHRDDRVVPTESTSDRTDIPFSFDGLSVVLVDDVLYTGRTVRAAMDALSELGRAGNIELAVLIDRGHRELPIRADYVGKNLPTAEGERVSVHVVPIDGDGGVWIDRAVA